MCDQEYPVTGWLTIIKNVEDSIKDASELALRALSWVVSDSRRSQRFLDITGLTADGLRAAITEPATLCATLGAVLDFLCAHEPDLLAAAESLGCEPADLAATRDRIAA